ncbi:uncharacterized protein [Parasteatoda tepidariorum]|uniref:uncharacterized protein n=1 Tax=Parasteatoda tepidariorum TaxID=114398 RepID=UPI0039BC5066
MMLRADVYPTEAAPRKITGRNRADYADSLMGPCIPFLQQVSPSTVCVFAGTIEWRIHSSVSFKNTAGESGRNTRSGFQTSVRKKKFGGIADMDDFDKCAVRQIIQDFYIREKKGLSLRNLIPVPLDSFRELCWHIRHRVSLLSRPDEFRKWLQEKLLPNLQPQSVVVMDNAPYHTKIENPTPKYATKSVMIDWLNHNGINCSSDMRKAELYALLESNRPKKVSYSIDKLRTRAILLLVFSPYHWDLNAIEFVWSTLKRFIRERNVTGDMSLNNLKSLFCEGLNCVTAEGWQAHCEHVQNLENKYWERDGVEK